jgi:predicted phosphoribosyltransferase
MRFRNRDEAGRILAKRLDEYRGRKPLVLAIPRGAITMARVIAEALHGDLDVVLVHKLRAPFQPELAVGAIDEAGHVYREGAHVEASEEDLAREIGFQQDVLRRRRVLYTAGRDPISPAGRIVIVVDDGIATGSSALAAVRAVRRHGPARLVVATAVAPPEAIRKVAEEADEVVCLHTTPAFFAVGQFFDDFSPVPDETVVEILRMARAAGDRDPVGAAASAE